MVITDVSKHEGKNTHLKYVSYLYMFFVSVFLEGRICLSGKTLQQCLSVFTFLAISNVRMQENLF